MFSQFILRLISLLLWGVLFFVLCPEVSQAQGDAYKVRVVLKTGGVFEAVIRDRNIIKSLEEDSELNLSQMDPKKMVTLYYVMGMNGTMGVYMGDLKRFKGIKALNTDSLKSIKDGIDKRIEKVREQEKIRLAKLMAQREALKKKIEEEKKDKQKQEAELAEKQAEKDKFKLLNRYPAEEGWGPEKKEELYRRGVVIGVFPDPDEQYFIDHYDEWLVQFQAWTELQKEADAAGEEKKAAEQSSEKKEEKKEKKTKKRKW